MGYYVTYHLNLRIPAQASLRALEIFNHLHTDQMLWRYARGGGGHTPNIQECYWYSWVNNPIKPYETLTEAFTNWNIVENQVTDTIDRETQDFLVSGSYDDKWGQQDFLIQQLAPVLNDTKIHVKGCDGRHFYWSVDNHEYQTWADVADV